MRRILVANRGEIARRVFRTARRMGLQTVAVYSEPDSAAPFVAEADLAIPLSGSTSAQSYLDVAQLLEAVALSRADAVHPGYGFLSENPEFAEAVTSAGATWIGPTPESIRAMALKVEAKRIAADAGVPLVPGAELGPGVDEAAAAAEVGYPLLVKASAGGGGKGMRVVWAPGDLSEALASARREAQASFADPTVFLERYLPRSRHVEVQVFGDRDGNVIHLGERECSIQRRHQKIVEESPSPGLQTHLARPMHEAAVSLARSIGYVGAGTVEFIVEGEGPDQRFYFLEMNTRLQVEHPVTEMVTGLDLVEWQVRVARGERLPLTQEQVRVTGHAIESRLYAEDPARGYLPRTGTLATFEVPHGVRVDSGVEDGSEVTPYYDPMLAKVIAHDTDRTTAAARLAGALRGARIHGLSTNRDSLVAILESTRFLTGDTTTAFLDEEPATLTASPPPEVVDRHLVAAVLDRPPTVDGVPSGWRNVAAVPELFGFTPLDDDEAHTVATLRLRDRVAVSRVAVGSAEPPRLATFLEGWEAGSSLANARDLGSVDVRRHGDLLDVTIGGIRTRCRVARYGPLVCVDDGLWSTQWRTMPRFDDRSADAAGRGPAAPVPGTVTVIEVAAGDHVSAGQTLVVLEAMKMEHRIVADVDGIVEAVLVEVGQPIEAHAVVAVLSSPEDSQ